MSSELQCPESPGVLAQPSPSTSPEIVSDLLERLAFLSINGGKDNPDRPPINSYVEASEPNGVRFVATPEYRAWFHRTYGGAIDEVPAPQASPVAKAEGTGARGRGLVKFKP